jgi:hypothetical protein
LELLQPLPHRRLLRSGLLQRLGHCAQFLPREKKGGVQLNKRESPLFF